MKNLRIFFMFLGVLLLLSFFIVVLNQTLQLTEYLYRIHPFIGQVASVVILLTFLFLISVPVFIYLRLPSVVKLPADDTSKDYERALKRIAARLCRNKHLQDKPLVGHGKEEIEKAIRRIDEMADQEIKNAAQKIFLFTAISQYGRLDGLIVMVILSRLIYKVALLYYQKPSIKEMVFLYSNVLATLFLVSEMENLEMIEAQFEPLFEETAGGMAVVMASGATNITSLLANSIIQGAANCFLALRIGVLVKKYSNPMLTAKRSVFLRSATVEAGKMLGGIVTSSTTTLTKALAKSGRKIVWGKFTNGKEKMSEQVSRIFNRKKDSNTEKEWEEEKI